MSTIENVDGLIEIQITYIAGIYKGNVIYFGIFCRYEAHSYTYSGCFCSLIDKVKEDRGTYLMDYNFTITFINKSYVKEVGQ
jgi:hypothetical protein